jgi:ATP-dependent Clp protease ATP-binding subunit ClpB
LLLGPRRAARLILRLVRIAGGFAYYSPVGFLCLVVGVLADAYCLFTIHILESFITIAIVIVGIISFTNYHPGPIFADEHADERMRSQGDRSNVPVVVSPEHPTEQTPRQIACVPGRRFLKPCDAREAGVAIEWRETLSPRQSTDVRDRLLSIRQHLDSEVVGQQTAKTALLEGLARAFSGLRARSQGPIAALVFCGPTAVGKTELAESLARALRWPSKLFPLGQAGREGLSWKLFGTERGYFGSQAGGELTQFLRVNPESVVIFDEFEKGLEKDPSLTSALLNLLSEGVAYENSTGRRFDASRCVIIFTSNALGSEPEIDRMSTNCLKDLFASRTMLPLEFVNRLTGVVPFRSLTDEELQQIARTTLHRMLSSFVDRNALHGLRIGVSSAVLQFLISHLDRKYGVRNLQDVIDQDVGITVAQAWMAHEEATPTALELNVAEDHVVATFG